MSMWWWPGVVLASTLLILNWPGFGWWAALAGVVLALSAELAISRWKLAALTLPLAIVALSAAVVVLVRVLST